MIIMVDSNSVNVIKIMLINMKGCKEILCKNKAGSSLSKRSPAFLNIYCKFYVLFLINLLISLYADTQISINKVKIAILSIEFKLSSLILDKPFGILSLISE